MDLLAGFRERFHVDMTDFDFSRHFGPEAGFNPLIYLYWLVFDRSALWKVPITVADLEEAARAGSWRPSSRPAV